MNAAVPRRPQRFVRENQRTTSIKLWKVMLQNYNSSFIKLTELCLIHPMTKNTSRGHHMSGIYRRVRRTLSKDGKKSRLKVATGRKHIKHELWFKWDPNIQIFMVHVPAVKLLKLKLVYIFGQSEITNGSLKQDCKI